MGVPTALVLGIKQLFNVSCFVETGTFQGGTAYWAGTVFPQVITIEGSKDLHAQAVTKFASMKNIQFLQGESPAILRQIMPTLPSQTIYWLDAHWSGGVTHGAENECPLLDEIRAIDSRPSESFILIDDARLFLSPPPLPHRDNQWPEIATVVSTLRERDSSRYVVVIEDLIIAVPALARDFLVQYCRKISATAS
jgi:hypothetical protein